MSRDRADKTPKWLLLSKEGVMTNYSHNQGILVVTQDYNGQPRIF